MSDEKLHADNAAKQSEMLTSEALASLNAVQPITTAGAQNVEIREKYE